MAENTTTARDEEGYLISPDEWTPQVADALAREEGIVLTPEHWLVIEYVREYHAEHGITPDIRHVARYLSQQHACDKRGGKAMIFELFPYGYVQQTCKIAGMKRPRAWSTG